MLFASFLMVKLVFSKIRLINRGSNILISVDSFSQNHLIYQCITNWDVTHIRMGDE